mmetsp:Transcript_42283/g.100257  ORF Transcript_42283/g.100257 Transcript_42283/m.100257 type:complete len:186 (+) Transcript_42283:1-558(+)
MAIAAAGVVSLASVDLGRRHYPLRSLISMALLLSLAGFALCIPWQHRFVPLNLVAGCCLASYGAWALTSMANQIVSEAVVKVYSEDGELVWLQMFWSFTRVPGRVLGPILLISLLERDPTGGLCFAVMLGCGGGAAVTLAYFRASLITPKVGQEAEVLPGLDLTLHASGGGALGARGRYAPDPLM